MTPVGEQGKRSFAGNVRQLEWGRMMFGVRHENGKIPLWNASIPLRDFLRFLPASLRESGTRRFAPLHTPSYMQRQYHAAHRSNMETDTDKLEFVFLSAGNRKRYK